MITKVKRIITALSLVAAFGVPVLAPALVSAAGTTTQSSTAGNLCNGANLDASKLTSQDTVDNTCNDDQASGTGVTNLIKLVINVFSLVVGVVAVIMIIIGGLKYITSGGDSGNVSGAKNTILYAVIGLVVVALAQFVVRFVLAKISTTVGSS